MKKNRADLHTHSILSDGELLPSELSRRAFMLGHWAIAITDHVDFSNMEYVIEKTLKGTQRLSQFVEIEVIPGVEITHVPPETIPKLVKKARKLGAKLIIVHGETIVEPVEKNTNKMALRSDIDILAHPGLLTYEEMEMAKDNGVFIELTSRRGHSITNGHIAKLASDLGAKLLVNTDAHSPEDLIDHDIAMNVAMGSGLGEKEAYEVVVENPKILLEKII
ncbi:MAG: histidinol phosphate phosphatase domain-containing protein [Candidatus Hydrothermarchaeota archaeon]